MIIILIIIFLLGAFTLVICLVYKWVQPLRYRAAIRTWLVVFYGEIFFLLLVPPHTAHLPGLPSLYKDGGVVYLMIFTTDGNNLIPGLLRGKRLEELLLLLLPLAPALVVFGLDYRRNRRAGKRPGLQAP
ncbi:hypothetical protein SAMN04515668_4824 [Hymenobacter arizonensis]|uniref:Uncharacterized protein n=1 Tax=Hymenobacter arizonensis TaxID=1227077 RepID=A0A1I6BNH6_HYMAR|nr:hypothetical protein SAMN04515668_4824 [Hymenobacter arizonensis]